MSQELQNIDQYARVKATVDDGAGALRNTCDNCFASKKGTYQTIRRNFGLTPCADCEVLYYCSENCRDEAWEHHHKTECTILSQMCHDLREDLVKVPSKSIRALVRLMCMQDVGMIPQEEWDEFLSLKVPTGIGRQRLHEYVEFLAEIVGHYKVTKLNENLVKNLVYAHFNNNLAMDQPLLRHSSSYPSGDGYITNGVCFEPFASMINHSCQPNSWWTFNGREFQLRAIRAIAAGEELSISYIGIAASYKGRQENVNKDWGFKCSCSLCEQGPQEPMGGPLYDKLLEIQKFEKSTSSCTASIRMNQDFIDDMLRFGFHVGNYPVPQLTRQIYTATLRGGDNIGALKVYLKLYYEIEHVAIPPPFPDDRINSLKKVISLIRTVQLIESPLMSEDIKNLLPHVRGYLSRRLCTDTEKCFGFDTEIAKFEREQYQKTFGQSTDGFNDRNRYLQEAKKLLKWAEVLSFSEENL